MVNSMRWAKPFVSGHTRALWLIGLLAVEMVLDLIAVISDLLEIGLLTRVVAGQTITNAEATASDYRQAIIAGAQLVLFVSTAILFLMWIHRAHRNLPALGAQQLKFTPGWAVGWFFVPFANLFMPYRVVTEIWKASDPNGDITDGMAWQNALPSPLIGCWWACWVIAGLLGRSLFNTSLRAETPSELLNVSWLSFFADVFSIVTTGLLIVLIRAIDARQAEKHGRLISHATSPTLPSPGVQTQESFASNLRIS
jgi:hypothetical protein